MSLQAERTGLSIGDNIYLTSAGEHQGTLFLGGLHSFTELPGFLYTHQTVEPQVFVSKSANPKDLYGLMQSYL
jgi:hypothetical protein